MLLGALLIVLAAAAAAAPVIVPSPLEAACGAEDATLMVLGSYHMDSPGQDRFNLQPDDILAPKRQREIADVLDRLARYAPTKIAIEGAYSGSAWPERYRQFSRGEYTLGRNEIDQLAFRLAQRLGHGEIHPIDFSMWMDGRVPAEIGEAKKRPAKAGDKVEPEVRDEPPAIFREMAEVQKTGTVLETLRFLNSERYMREDHALYVKSLRPDPYSDALYGSTDPVANWYKRNLRMFTNLYRLAEPRQRVLLVVGAGHLTILRRLAVDAPDICLVEAAAHLN